jgi:hypothetical protein
MYVGLYLCSFLVYAKNSVFERACRDENPDAIFVYVLYES